MQKNYYEMTQNGEGKIKKVRIRIFQVIDRQTDSSQCQKFQKKNVSDANTIRDNTILFYARFRKKPISNIQLKLQLTRT